ncbi:MAG: 30S ribosomal protein S10 [Candidatus Bathyarchaeota archaeon]|nr:30S ribosomal protein S10 [Candidatus Bathyarchaeota archaeon]
MPGKARIRLSSREPQHLISICEEIKKIAEKTAVKLRGPVPLPTKKLVVSTRKTPCGQGTRTWDKWEMRIHKRLIDVDPNERFLKRLMRIRTPDDVFIEIELL